MTSECEIAQPRASKEACIEDLKFIKILIPENVRLIPKELIESVKGRLFSVEQFYKYQEDQAKHENAANLLYVLMGKDKKIEGYLWLEMNQLDKSLFVNTFSISKKYWYKGKAMYKAVDWVEKIKNKHACPRVFWCTVNERFFVKHGFKKSQTVLMEAA